MQDRGRAHVVGTQAPPVRACGACAPSSHALPLPLPLPQVHSIMTRNIQEVLGQGEKLDNMARMSSSLAAESKQYAKRAKSLHWQVRAGRAQRGVGAARAGARASVASQPCASPALPAMPLHVRHWLLKSSEQLLPCCCCCRPCCGNTCRW